MWPSNARPFGHRFIANFEKPNAGKSELSLPSLDPRKQRFKPDAYPVVVEEVGSLCQLVAPGDTIVIERWEYEQMDVRDGCIVCHERDVLICANSQPAPGVIVVELIDQDTPKFGLVMPSKYKLKTRPILHGKVSHSSAYEHPVGREIYFEKGEKNQYRLGTDKIIFRIDDSVAAVVAERSTDIDLEVI